MAYVPIATAETSRLDTTSFEQLPPGSRWEGYKADAEETFFGSYEILAAGTTAKWLTRQYYPQFLSTSEAKIKYPNMSAPQGGYDSDLRFASDEKHRTDFNNVRLNNMPPGLLSMGTRLGGTLTAMLLSPSLWLTGGVARAAVKLAEPFISELIGAGTIRQLSVKAGLGAAEFNFAFAPQMYSEKKHKDMIQESETARQIGENILLNSLFGAIAGGLSFFGNGIFNSLLGFRQIADKNSVRAALKITEDQILSRKKVNISPILKDGIFRQSKLARIPEDDILSRIKEKNDLVAKEEIEKSSIRIEALKKNQGVLIDTLKERAKKDQALPIQTRVAIDNILSRVEHPEAKKLRLYSETGMEEEFKTFHKTESVLTKSKWLRLKDYLKNDLQTDKKIAQEEIGKTKTKISKLSEDLERTEVETEKIKIQNKIEEVKNKLKKTQSFVEQIGKRKKIKNPFDAELRELEKNQEIMDNERSNIGNHLDVQNSLPLLQYLRDDILPLDKEELTNAVKKATSLDSDLMLDGEEIKKQDKLLKTPDTELDKELKEYEEILEDQYKNKQLSAEEKSEFEEDMKDSEQAETTTKALKAFLRCVISGGKSGV